MRFGLSLLALCGATAQLSHAGWVVWTNQNPGVSAAGVFAGSSGAYAGTVNATVSNGVSGLANGFVGLDGRSYPNADLTPSFLANYAANPNGAFTVLANSYNDTLDAYTITLDFTGLANGFLPAGSLFTILDLDIGENYRNVQATGENGNPILTAWLAALNGQAGLLDWYSPAFDGDQTGFVTGPASSLAGGVYQFLGPPNVNDTSALAGFATTENLRSIRIQFDRNNNGTAIAGTGGPGLAISDVPEPASCLTMAGGLILFGLRRLRHRGGNG
jgi:tetrahydromethanopterin S-methyltransferase subunit F